VPVKQLSGGFQRRLSVALSLVNDPELLILDEPTTGLDPAVRLALWARIRALRAEGKTILLTTHYMDEAQRLCDRVAIIAAGKVLAEGPPDELIAAHLAPEALECECTEEEVPNLLDGLPVAHVLRTGDRLTMYAHDVARLAEAIRTRDGGERRTLVLRPANLEDVFLALTGSSLEEGEP
jgi:lipooligosaccharide transport system ATP-binding protein